MSSFFHNMFEEGWATALSKHFNEEKFKLIGKKIALERKRVIIYPESKLVFRAFKETPYNEVKCVILAQDPYHDGSADGLALSNSRNTLHTSPSLRVILDEIARDYPESVSDIGNGRLDPLDLSRWARQGVLLVNTSFTVEKSKPGSHSIYWTGFTKAVIKALNDRNDIVWLLMGVEARRYSPLITNTTHAIVETVHPAAGLYSAHNNFIGSGAFRKVNEALEARNKSQIVW